MQPLFTIWFSPRKTFRYLIDHYDPISVWLLAVLAGIKECFNWASTFGMGERHAVDFIGVLIVVVGPLMGAANWIAAFFTRWVGRKFDGHGTLEGIFAVLVWSALPVIIILPYRLLLIFAFGAQAFTPGMAVVASHSGDAGLILLSFGWGLLQFLSAIWGLILMLVGISEVQGFTKWNAFANLCVAGFLTYLIFGLPIYFLFRL